MTKKTATPAEISEALALREAGYTALSISQRLGISVRSLQRHFADHGTKKGAIKEEVLAQARADLLKRVTSDDAVREEAARLINDDLAHARHLREIMLNASEQLQATSLKDAALVMRAAAAYSTAIKNTSDVLRQTLRIDRAVEDAGVDVTVIAGESHGVTGAVTREATAPLYLDIDLPAGGRFAQILPPGHNAFLYVYRGEVQVAGSDVPTQRMAILANDPDADGVLVEAVAPSRVLLIAGQPLRESIAQYGPFVMNNEQEIYQTLADYREGRLA